MFHKNTITHTNNFKSQKGIATLVVVLIFSSIIIVLVSIIFSITAVLDLSQKSSEEFNKSIVNLDSAKELLIKQPLYSYINYSCNSNEYSPTQSPSTLKDLSISYKYCCLNYFARNSTTNYCSSLKVQLENTNNRVLSRLLEVVYSIDKNSLTIKISTSSIVKF